ncbi:MAG: hypothetical protein HRU40_16980 [Saprospiraceae bacterium]|nr:hypothetical protein [Saprospiraceae bacterium]
MDSLTINLRNKRDKLVDTLHLNQSEIDKYNDEIKILKTNLSKTKGYIESLQKDQCIFLYKNGRRDDEILNSVKNYEVALNTITQMMNDVEIKIKSFKDEKKSTEKLLSSLIKELNYIKSSTEDSIESSETYKTNEDGDNRVLIVKRTIYDCVDLIKRIDYVTYSSSVNDKKWYEHGIGNRINVPEKKQLELENLYIHK